MAGLQQVGRAVMMSPSYWALSAGDMAGLQQVGRAIMMSPSYWALSGGRYGWLAAGRESCNEVT